MPKKKSTIYALKLANALKERGIHLELEHWDGHKHVDIYVPKARIYIEVDGPLHDIKPKQLVSDFNRDYFSYKEGFFTKHITNEEIEFHLEEIANAIFSVITKASNTMGENLKK
jgi:very-short-patch-repair endonuclease